MGGAEMYMKLNGYSMYTQSLTPQQWGICLVAAVFFLFVGEILRLILRLTAERPKYEEGRYHGSRHMACIILKTHCMYKSK
jgi:hypothetical protein